MPRPTFLLVCVLALLLPAGTVSAQAALVSETFDSGLGVMSSAGGCSWPLGSGTAGWNLGDGSACVDSPDGNGFARFGIFPGCASYSDSDLERRLSSPQVSDPSCRQLTLRYRYFLDFDEGPGRDRAQVRVGRSQGGTTTYSQVANNGWVASQQQGICSVTTNDDALENLLLDDAMWHVQKIDLTDQLPADSLSVSFVGLTRDGVDNAGQGFMIDEVELLCSRAGDPVQVNDLTVGQQYGPAVGRADDLLVVAWTDFQDDFVRVRRFDGSQNPLGSSAVVNAPGQSAERPALAVASDGSFVVVHEEISGILGQRFDATGGKVGPVLTISGSANAARPAVAMDSSGNFAAVWQEADSDGSGIRIRFFTSAGNPFGTSTQVNTTTVGDQLWPAISMRADGRAVVVWSDDALATSAGRAYAQRFDANRNPLGGEIPMHAADVIERYRPTVSMAESGVFAVAWNRRDQVNLEGSIGVRIFGANGIPMGPELVGPPDNFYFGPRPVVARSTGSDFSVFWLQDTGSLTDAELRHRRVGAGGSWASDQEVVAIVREPLVGVDGGQIAVDPDARWLAFPDGGSPVGDDGDSDQILALEFLDPLFADGFESGGIGAWSSHTP